MSSAPPATCSKKGFARSYMAWLATEATVQRCPGCMAVTETASGVTVPRMLSLPMKGSAAMASRQPADDVRILIDATIRAGVGRGAHDHGHAELPRGQEHELQVVPLPLLGTAVLIGSERLGADIAAPGIRDDGIGSPPHADLEAPALDGSESQMPGRRENAQAVRHGRSHVRARECVRRGQGVGGDDGGRPERRKT